MHNFQKLTIKYNVKDHYNCHFSFQIYFIIKFRNKMFKSNINILQKFFLKLLYLQIFTETHIYNI